MRISIAVVLLLAGCRGRELAAISARVDSLSSRVGRLESKSVQPAHELISAPVVAPSKLIESFAESVEHDPDLVGYPRMLGIPMSKIIGRDGRVIDPVGLANRIRTAYVKQSGSRAFPFLVQQYGNEIGAAIYYGRVK